MTIIIIKGHIISLCFYIFDTDVDFCHCFGLFTSYFSNTNSSGILLDPFPCGLKFSSFLIRLTFWFTWLPSK